MNIFRKIVLENMKKNRMRTAVMIAGVILSTAMLTAVFVCVQSSGLSCKVHRSI